MTATSDGIAVVADGLGKQYHIGRPQGGGSVYDQLARILGRRSAPVGVQHPMFWALHDVSFTVKRGEVMGVLGRNGSGKTTLMKILARVTSPTAGMVRVDGRVGALIEVGAGFHPELTGRDNILLSGAILGMSRPQIAAVRDEIVAFADIGPFLDTAVKFYSSGMYVRLAFAVSSHLDADTLLVDEVLAVGDAEYQQKCLRRIHDLVRAGRTVMFVSHSMDSVRELCDSAIVLDAGRVRYSGTAPEAVDFYEREILREVS